MESKSLSLFALSVLSLVLLMSFASATITFSDVPPTLSQTGTSFQITVSTDLTENIDFTATTITQNEKSITFASLSSVPFTGNSSPVTINYVVDTDFDFFIGSTYSTTLTADGDVSPNATQTLSFAPSTFCKDGAVNETDLELKVEINNIGEGKDEKWLPLDTIEIEVELENDKNQNDGDGDLNDVIFEIGLFEKGTNKNVMDDMIWISDEDEEFEFGDIDEDDDGTHIFEFRIDPDEVESGEYIMVIKAYPDGAEDEVCIDSSSDLNDFGSSIYYADIEIKKEGDRDKMVVVDEESLPLPIEAFCSEKVSLSVDVYNIGSRDFEDQIMVSLFNNELGIDLKEVALGDLDEGENTNVVFSFTVPSDAEEKRYTLLMNTFYDYDSGDGKYEDDYDRRSEDTFNAYLRVEGNCGPTTAEVSISASLQSGGKAGQDLVVRATITNNGDELDTFTINAAGFTQWASSYTVDRTILVLGAGNSADVLFTFDVNKDALGSQSFTIELVSDDNQVTTQPVSVAIEGRSGLFGFTGGVISGNNAYLWGIGALNIILVIIIIIVAVRVARR